MPLLRETLDKYLISPQRWEENGTKEPLCVQA